MIVYRRRCIEVVLWSIGASMDSPVADDIQQQILPVFRGWMKDHFVIWLCMARNREYVTR